jgi:hypothetical protein
VTPPLQPIGRTAITIGLRSAGAAQFQMASWSGVPDHLRVGLIDPASGPRGLAGQGFEDVSDLGASGVVGLHIDETHCAVWVDDQHGRH